ncbi:DNA-binding protein [Caedibacter taeniospiralis]|uniref:DNA-binding protein n=1 Tax=Caedibacter taeniospiralis TaxID=28907 RepID=UPI000C27EBD8|nr:hypothetical protein [Caedibacter taeniospiralis]
MSEDNQISYEELAAVAERLNQEGRKVTLEYVRRELRRGTHAQIAVLLGKWQKENPHLSNEVKPKFRSTETRAETSYGAGSNNKLRRPDISSFKSRKLQRNCTQESSVQNGHKKPYSRTQFIGNSNSDESYAAIAPREPLTLERLQQETEIIQKLFQALAAIRSSRLEALEQYQSAQSELFTTRMDCDQKVREFQKRASEKLLGLQTEFSRLKTISEQEIIAIRRKLSL